jgi:hypothetical protein
VKYLVLDHPDTDVCPIGVGVSVVKHKVEGLGRANRLGGLRVSPKLGGAERRTVDAEKAQEAIRKALAVGTLQPGRRLYGARDS